MTLSGTAVRLLWLPALFPLSCLRDDGTKSPEDEYAGRYARAKCSVMGPCCSANGFSWDQGNCELGGAGYVQSGVDVAKQHGAVFDPAAADECIRLTQDATAQCTSNAAVEEACGKVFTGTKPAGSACTTDLDCAASSEGRGACFWTSPAGQPLSGVCVIKTRPAAVGDPCGSTSGAVPTTVADCDADGLQCTLNGTCQPLGVVGDACGALARCADTAYCDAATSTCKARLAAGSTCTGTTGDKYGDAQCLSALCLSGRCADNGVGAPTPCNGTTRPP